MAMNDYGLYALGSVYLGETFEQPAFVEFGIGSGAFNGSTYNLNTGIIRKEGTWKYVKNDPVLTVELLTTDMVGSDVGELGIGSGAVVGSNLHSRSLSAIGVKTADFSVTINQKIRIRRLV